MNEPLFIGLLSGTSMDAIDVALVSFAKETPALIATLNHPIPLEFKKRCLAIAESDLGSIDDFGYLDAMAGVLFSEAVLAMLQKTGISPKQIRAIGSHGQNIRHRPNANPPFTLQIGDPNIIAERTGIPTIADFRRRDLAAGGQGAPLAPAFHRAAFGSAFENRIIVNIGGIANLSILNKDPDKPLLGFDSGPGNCLMDAWVQQHWQIPFDNNGEHAAKGKIIEALLSQCLADPYFALPAPKSTGREYFNISWLKSKMQAAKIINPSTSIDNPSILDIQATLLHITAKSIAEAIRATGLEANIFICGGGAHNVCLMKTLQEEMGKPIHSTETLGYPPDWIEALLFAWLAKQTLEGKSGNCPSVTGAKHAVPLGGIFGYCPSE